MRLCGLADNICFSRDVEIKVALLYDPCMSRIVLLFVICRLYKKIKV